MIEFKNTEATQAGISIQELRRRNELSLYEFAAKANLSCDYLTCLEEGHEDKVADEIIERILVAGRVFERGRKYTGEEFKRILLSIRSPIPPEQKLL